MASKVEDKYSESASIYKAHSEVFVDDLNYYLDFSKGHRTLDMFAGYGRITNFLAAHNVDVHSVELNPYLSSQINLPNSKAHVANVLTFQSNIKFSRIVAGYNSFCLFTKPQDIKNFFQNLSNLLVIGGRASLNYYSTDRWIDAVEYKFNFNGRTVSYKPSYDLSNKKSKLGVWIDEYLTDTDKFTHRYDVRVYEGPEDILPFIVGTGLRLFAVIKEFNLPESKVLEPGWIDYVLERTE